MEKYPSYFMEHVRTYPGVIVTKDKRWRFSDSKTMEEFEEKFLSVRHEDDLVKQYRYWLGGNKGIHLSDDGNSLRS